MQRSRRSRRAFVRSVAGAPFLAFAEKRGLAQRSIPVAVRGERPYSIFLSNEASLSERWAAEELRQHIERMTGIQLPIESGAGVPASRRAIAIGGSALTEACGVQPPAGEACLLKTAGETVIVAGGRQRGSMYGVSILLEKLGCRWFTADVARIPAVESLKLSEFDEEHRPAFDYREVFFTEAQEREWSARNRLNGHFHQLDERVGGKITYMPFTHSFYELVPPARYFDAHPEYFALVEGRRRREHAQLCLTNTALLQIALKQVERWLAEQPDISIVSISQNDAAGWCECEPCRQVINEEGATSGLALRFVNQVAERIAATHPDMIIDMLAYQETADPPSKVRPRSNVHIRFCPIDACQSHSYTRCVFNRTTRHRLEAWSRIAPKLHVWIYSINFAHYLLPFPNYDELASDIPNFRRAGVSGLFIEGAVSPGGGGDDAELRSYLAARLLWNPDLNPEREIRDFQRTVYGEAAAPLLWDLHVLRQLAVRRGEHLWIDQNVDARYLTADFLRDGRALLRRALEKAGSDAARRRIERQLLSFDYVKTIRERRCAIRNSSYGPADLSRAAQYTGKLLQNAEGLGVTTFREGFPLTEQAHLWNDLKAPYAAVVLNDGAAQAAVIPELEGRVVTLGRPNLLRAPDPGEWRYPNTGGIHVSVYGGDQMTPYALQWQLASNRSRTVTLRGSSHAGLALNMEVAVAEKELRLRITVMNSGDGAARFKIGCQAEFACGSPHAALLTYPEQPGKRLRPIRFDDSSADGSIRSSYNASALSGDGLLLRCETAKLDITNRVPGFDTGYCTLNWSFRDSAGLEVAMSVESPEIDLAPGQRFVLNNEYSWRVA